MNYSEVAQALTKNAFEEGDADRKLVIGYCAILGIQYISYKLYRWRGAPGWAAYGLSALAAGQGWINIKREYKEATRG